MHREHDLEDRELSVPCELTGEELDAVSGGCGEKCCQKGPCDCG